jgi:hypothetical protein
VIVVENFTYEAIFKANTYTVRFYANNSEVHSTEVIQGSSIEGSNSITGSKMPHNPTAYRQYFKKWTYNNQDFTGTTRVNGSIRVDAQFGTPSITISGGAAGGNETTFRARTEPANMAVQWRSSNDQVIGVDGGKITAKYFGTVTVTASFVMDGQTYSASKTVEAKPSIELELYQRRDGFNSSSNKGCTYGPYWWRDSNNRRIINSHNIGMRFYYNYHPGANTMDSRYGNCGPGVFYGRLDVTWSQINGAKIVGPHQKMTKSMIVHDTATTGPYAGIVNPQVGYNASDTNAYIFYNGSYDQLWFIKATHAPLPSGNGYYDYYISKIN